MTGASPGVRPESRWRRYPLVERFGYYLVRTRAWARRSTRLGLALRALVWLTGFGALLVALPPTTLTSTAPLLAAVLAVLAAAAPGGRWPTLLAVIAIGLVAVRLRAEPPAAPVPVCLATGVLLYLQHTGAALAALLRTDTVIPPVVLRHWAMRAGLVLAASAGVGVGVLVLPVPATPSATGFLLLGAACAVVLAAVLAWFAVRASQPR